MEKFLHQIPPPQNPKPISRPPWKRFSAELNGRISSKLRHEDSQLLLDSYCEVKAFGHRDNNGSEYCATYIATRRSAMYHAVPDYYLRNEISGLEFDSKGFYLASVTKSGCLTVHDFETLYCNTYGPSSSLLQDGAKPLLHIATRALDVVRWNPTNQDEFIVFGKPLDLALRGFLETAGRVACTSRHKSEVLIYDIGLVSSKPVEVLKKGWVRFSRLSDGVREGLSDITFASADKSRLLASALDGAVYLWDRRSGDLPCVELNANSQNQLNSIQLDMEDRVVFGASNQGNIYFWDLRGGRSSSVAFQRPNEANYPPLRSLKVSSMLEKITSLKVFQISRNLLANSPYLLAQTTITSREIHSISIDPSCSYQLAFHLDDGWSGILNLNTLSVTHLHCPPPAWLVGVDMSSGPSILRRPSWLPTHSIFAVASSSGKGIFLLDFFPGRNSACYVDYNVELEGILEESKGSVQNKYFNVSEDVKVCAAHPLNGTIVAGSKQTSLLLISQSGNAYKGSEESG